MKEKGKIIKQATIAVFGVFFLVAVAFLVYCMVEDTIVQNEKESLKSLAEVNAQSLKASLNAKSNLIYAALSGDMDGVEEIEQGILKVGERSCYYTLEEAECLDDWKKEKCVEAGTHPGEVIVGPIRQSEKGYYTLYMTKAVYMKRSIAGYVQVELNLDEVYAQEQALSNLQIGNGSYCIVKNKDGNTIMPSGNIEDGDELLAEKFEDESGTVVVRTYQTEVGTPVQRKKLVAYDYINVGEEQLTFCVVEDYNLMVKPIERIAFSFCVLGVLLFGWTGIFIYKIINQQKEEEQLMLELKHEKELNKAIEALKKQEEMMQKYNHSKTMGVLTGAIAHEFNNLMTPIVLYTELLEENEIVNREMSEEIEDLKNTVFRCKELAKQLLNYSRQGRAEKVLTEYNATFAVQSSVNMVEKIIPENIKLKTQICKTPYYVYGQLGTLNQIILNLVTNAIHAMEGTGGILKIQFGLSVDDERTVRLIIEDTGTGIPKEVQPHVFEPFYTTKGEGNGIGLTVVRRMVEEHGGDIYVKSEEEKGTTFILEFPIYQKN